MTQMTSKPTLRFLIGIPASGKSHYAELMQQNNKDMIVLSSDKLREELLGNINDQSKNGEVFNELHKRAIAGLKNENDVIIDATNISMKKRISFLNQIKNMDCNKIAVYFDTPIYTCIANNLKRERSIPVDVIERMYTNLQIPIWAEGWDDIKIVHSRGQHIDEPKTFFEMVFKGFWTDHDTFFKVLNSFKIFNDIYNLPHDSLYHSFSVSRHTFYVFNAVKQIMLDKYEEIAPHWLLMAALLHDVGKAYTKKFKDGKRYANFIGHENVGAQLAIGFLYECGYDDEFILKVAEIVALHMRLMNMKNEDEEMDFMDFVGAELYKDLNVLYGADLSAK